MLRQQVTIIILQHEVVICGQSNHTVHAKSLLQALSLYLQNGAHHKVVNDIHEAIQTLYSNALLISLVTYIDT